MTIWIDADGCPVVALATKIAKAHKLPVVIVKNYAVSIKDDYATVITVEVSNDAVDFYIVNHMVSGDLVITQDYGLAAMVFSKNGKCINQNGRLITTENIDFILEQRHTSKVARMQNKHHTKFKKRQAGDDKAFESAFSMLINETK